MQFSASLPRFMSMWLDFDIPRSDLQSVQSQVLVMGGDRDMISHPLMAASPPAL